jgi:hypothetical protein
MEFTNITNVFPLEDGCDVLLKIRNGEKDIHYERAAYCKNRGTFLGENDAFLQRHEYSIDNNFVDREGKGHRKVLAYAIITLPKAKD